jgi:hypothetical protein
MTTSKSKSKKSRKAKREKKSFPKITPPVKSSSSRFKPTRPITLIDKKRVRAKLNNISEVTLWDRIRTGLVPEGRVMGPDKGRLTWIEEEIDNLILNAPRRRPKGSTVAP